MLRFAVAGMPEWFWIALCNRAKFLQNEKFQGAALKYLKGLLNEACEIK